MLSMITKRKIKYLISWYGFCGMLALFGEILSYFKSGFDLFAMMFSFIVVVFGLGTLVAIVGLPSTEDIVKELVEEKQKG